MKTDQPQITYLKDYTPTSYLVDTLELEFDLFDSETVVRSKIKFLANPSFDSNSASENQLDLFGEELELVSIHKNGVQLLDSQYEVTNEMLTLLGLTESSFELEIRTKIFPHKNTSLEGLYASNGMLCTQCEPEGFRKITYYPDRPDVLAKFTTKIIGSKKMYPVLLSNGNLIDQGDLTGDRHWALWEDPFPKPSYLFALVAGQLECVRDQFVTASGKTVDLHFYVESKDTKKCDYAILALKKAMKWDEDTFGLEYDLDLYMIVAVHHFNMGAMENKGLNLFNTKYVLSSGKGATDMDLENIDGVIGHEYFHNWTGNRVTCRDWFQLSLKEGLTVFRDQEFVADLTSRGVKRIEDVNSLRTTQFSEDSGPLAHPVRPESFMEINNFYTCTVYSKGAEVVRMIRSLTGKAGFRKGMDLYFKKFDGQAVTTDDFVAAMEEANDLDLSHFRLWYSQAGTPQIEVSSTYDSNKNIYSLTLKQSALPNHQANKPMFIPIRLGLMTQSGEDIPLNCSRLYDSPEKDIIILEKEKQVFEFEFVPEKPIVSLLRDFSAPVNIKSNRSMEEWANLFQFDSDPFCRWEAGLELKSHFVLNGAKLFAEPLVEGNVQPPLPEVMHQAYQAIINEQLEDKKYLAWLLELPEPNYLMEKMPVIDVENLFKSWNNFRQLLAAAFAEKFVSLYNANLVHSDSNAQQPQGVRRLNNVLIRFLALLKEPQIIEIIYNQYKQANNMTDQLGALIPIVNNDFPHKAESLNSFYSQWKEDPLVIDKWFTIQACSVKLKGVDEIEGLLGHPDFSMDVPNRMRSVIGAFAFNNPLQFHHSGGRGYEFITDKILHLDKFNPQMASFLMGSLASWQKFDSLKSDLMKGQLERILRADGLSKGTLDKARRSLSLN